MSHNSKAGTNTNKDVIYIDVDDEITSIIEKVRASDKKIIALVLPKRATVLQSLVSMKLLKRATDQSKKNVVLITAEHGLLPLAGSVGMYVAKSLGSRPEIPDTPTRVAEKLGSIENVDEAEVDKSKTVGELSGVLPSQGELDETIELSDEDENTDSKQPVATKNKAKKFKIPNFNKFRLMLVLGVLGALLLGAAAYAALVVMPRAKITIKTNSTSINYSAAITLKTGADVTLDIEQAVIPAQSQEVKKTLTQQVAASGQVNNGEKATGSVKLSLTDCSKDQVTVPAGTGLSAGGKTFITTTSATMQSVKIGSNCKNSDFSSFSTETVDVQAQAGGSSYNIGPSTFTVAGFSNVTGQSSRDMSGGTDNITKIVTQADIDSAKQKIGEQETGPIQQDLKTALIDRGLYVIDATFSVGTPETKLSVQANTPAENVTVTQTIAYTMLGVKRTDLEKFIEKGSASKIDIEKQSILDHGLDKATFSIQTVNTDGVSLALETTVIAGAELDSQSIKKQVAGKKAHDAKEIIESHPGVTDVIVEYSPFWVSSIPKNTSKITVIVQEPQIIKHEESSP